MTEIHSDELNLGEVWSVHINRYFQPLVYSEEEVTDNNTSSLTETEDEYILTNHLEEKSYRIPKHGTIVILTQYEGDGGMYSLMSEATGLNKDFDYFGNCVEELRNLQSRKEYDKVIHIHRGGVSGNSVTLYDFDKYMKLNGFWRGR